MRNSKLTIFLFLVIFSIVVNGEVFGSQNYTSVAAQININKLSMWVQSDGTSGYNPFIKKSRASIPWGIIYPHGIPVGLVYSDGLVWGGFVHDGQEPKLRVGGHTYYNGLQPGAILTPGIAEDPADPKVNRVWRYRSDWRTADLTTEAYDILISKPTASSQQFTFSPAELKAVADSLRIAYEMDLQDWPWQKGAPFYDTNDNGVMDKNEDPGLLNAAQIVWYVANDLNPEKTLALYGSPPIGIEMQVTLWAFTSDADIQNSIYRRVRIIYKGTDKTLSNSTIDSMALGFYSEIDIGDFGDDFGGTDTTLQMVYGYNSITQDPAYLPYTPSVPAFGYTLLFGPIVPSSNENDVAIFDFVRRKGYRNLPMTGGWIDRAGDTDSQPSIKTYDGTLQYYNILNGFRPRPITPPDPFRNPASGQPIRFSSPGDPVNSTGWLDENPGNRQLVFSTGNFNMASGDTQEVVIIMTAGLGADRLASVNAMKFFARKASEMAKLNFVSKVDEHAKNDLPESFQFYQNFPNPFNSSTIIQYALTAESRVKLTIYDISGKEVKRLLDENQNAGRHSGIWDGTDNRGEMTASGVYFYKIEVGDIIRSGKMILIR